MAARLGAIERLYAPCSEDVGRSDKVLRRLELRSKSRVNIYCLGSSIKDYGSGSLKDMSDPNAVHEANLLMLDISKAKFKLGWEPRMNIDQCAAFVADWYKRYKTEDVYNLCINEIETFVK